MNFVCIINTVKVKRFKGSSFLLTKFYSQRHHELLTLKWNEFLSIVQLHSISDFSVDFLFVCPYKPSQNGITKSQVSLLCHVCHVFSTVKWENMQFLHHYGQRRYFFPPVSPSVIDQSFQSSSSCFPTRTCLILTESLQQKETA